METRAQPLRVTQTAILPTRPHAIAKLRPCRAASRKLASADAQRPVHHQVVLRHKLQEDVLGLEILLQSELVLVLLEDLLSYAFGHARQVQAAHCRLALKGKSIFVSPWPSTSSTIPQAPDFRLSCSSSTVGRDFQCRRAAESLQKSSRTRTSCQAHKKTT